MVTANKFVETDDSKSVAPKRPLQPPSRPISTSLRRQNPRGVLQSYLNDSGTLSEIHSRCESIGCIAFNLPPLDSLSGKALKHCLNELNRLFDKHSPLISKSAGRMMLPGGGQTICTAMRAVSINGRIWMFFMLLKSRSVLPCSKPP